MDNNSKSLDPKELAAVYERFADKNINVINADISNGEVLLVLEYALERHSDGKFIWPKIAVADSNIYNTAILAEQTIDSIRRY